MRSQFDSGSERLDKLLAAYGASMDAVEPSPNFMPELWARIDARQRTTYVLGRLTRGFVTAALALSLALLYIAPNSSHTAVTGTYVEALDATQAQESFEYPELVHFDASDTVWVDEL
jgi:hypothetical protein